jgi:acyl-CoA thioester hydrolase
VSTTETRKTSYRTRVRYLEVDQQGVVFNMWYLGYFDEAMSLFLAEGGVPYSTLLASGHDVQLVHTEIDWTAALKWDDDARIDVFAVGSGQTSFTLQFEVFAGDSPIATGRTVYVVVATDGSGKRPIPPLLQRALSPVA